MTRGTTPQLTFELPFAVAGLADMYVTFAQNGKIILEKDKSDIDVVNMHTFALKLTQADTLALQACTLVEMQIRAKTTAGDVIASEIFRANVSRILKDGEI